MSICIPNCVRCNWVWCFGNTAIQLQSPHKRPLILRLDVFFVVSLSKLLKRQSSCWCWITSWCVISFIFSFKYKLHTQILKFLREINHDYNLINVSLRWYVLSSSLPGRIISVISLKVCTHICYNGWGGANSLVLISPPHKPSYLFWLCPGIDLLPPEYSSNMQIQTF